VATSRKVSQIDTCVRCPTCSWEIPLVGTLRLPREYSVLCPNCGQRKVYQAAQAHDLKQDAEATKTSGRIIQFGTKKAMEPKSWLN
jgi:predicted RNA-binding Zn-ribbon protein involved in translation (DUF1610 family)